MLCGREWERAWCAALPEHERLTRASLNRKIEAARESGKQLDARKLTDSEFRLHIQRLGLTGGGTPIMR